jgi:HrpA-like RNA helicase
MERDKRGTWRRIAKFVFMVSPSRGYLNTARLYLSHIISFTLAHNEIAQGSRRCSLPSRARLARGLVDANGLPCSKHSYVPGTS